MNHPEQVPEKCMNYYIEFKNPFGTGTYLVEDTGAQMHLGIYLPLLSVTLIFACLILYAIIHNSWHYGYKQYRFRESYLLAGFYITAGMNMLT